MLLDGEARRNQRASQAPCDPGSLGPPGRHAYPQLRSVMRMLPTSGGASPADSPNRTRPGCRRGHWRGSWRRGPGRGPSREGPGDRRPGTRRSPTGRGRCERRETDPSRSRGRVGVQGRLGRFRGGRSSPRRPSFRGHVGVRPPSGSQTVKAVPVSGALSTSIQPPWRSTISLQMARPRPVPASPDSAAARPR